MQVPLWFVQHNQCAFIDKLDKASSGEQDNRMPRAQETKKAGGPFFPFKSGIDERLDACFSKERIG
ncbi:hypothetical protein D3C84_1081150 [compost metagenome]